MSCAVGQDFETLYYEQILLVTLRKNTFQGFANKWIHEWWHHKEVIFFFVRKMDTWRPEHICEFNLC